MKYKTTPTIVGAAVVATLFLPVSIPASASADCPCFSKADVKSAFQGVKFNQCGFTAEVSMDPQEVALERFRVSFPGRQPTGSCPAFFTVLVSEDPLDFFCRQLILGPGNNGPCTGEAVNISMDGITAEEADECASILYKEEFSGSGPMCIPL